jgi:hypothetical protein
VTDAQPSPRVRVGVVFARDPSDLGEWLRDAAAFDAAGADALWLDVARQPELDPLVVAAALSVVTFRSQLFVSLAEPDLASPACARALSTVDRLSGGRVRVVTDAETLPFDVGSGVGMVRRRPESPESLEDIDGNHWNAHPTPDGRAGWQAALLAALEGDVHGLIIPASPGLLDLLRNPDDEGDRRDLQLSVG